MNHKFLYFLSFLVLFLSCSNENQKKKAVIEYTDLSKLTDKSYISIDGVAIPHSYSGKLIRYNKAIPAQYINTFDSKSKNAPMFKADKVTVVEKLRDILAQKKEYEFDSIFFIEMNKRLIFYRKDGKPVQIKTSKEYPAQITYRDN